MLKKRGKQILTVFMSAVMCFGQPLPAAASEPEETEIFTDEEEIFISGEQDTDGFTEEETEEDIEILSEEVADGNAKNSGIVCSPKNGTVFEPIRPEEFDHLGEDSDVEEMPARELKIVNKGNKSVTIRTSSLKNFYLMKEKYDENMVFKGDGDKAEILEPGENLYIRFLAKSSEATFKENISISVSDGTKLKYTLSQECPHVISYVDYVKVTPNELNFGEKETGYSSAPKAKKVTVTNISKETIRLEHKGTPKAFKVSRFNKITLKPGEKASYTIQPQTGLKGCKYSEWLAVRIFDQKNGMAEYKINAVFNVLPYNPVEIDRSNLDFRQLRNGREKTVDGLDLPKIAIVFLDESKCVTESCDIIWDLDNCTYDPANKKEQNFVVNGIVQLPDNMKNGNNTDLRVCTKRRVDAYVSLQKPVIKKVTESSNNAADVFFEEWNSGASGWDVVAAKSLEKLKKGEYCLSSLGNGDIGYGHCIFRNVEKGTYYFVLRLYEYVNGEKIYSEWSEPVKLVKTARLPKKAVIKSVKIKGSTVQVTVKRDSNSDGYDAVLSKDEFDGTPYRSAYVVKNKKETTFTFTKVKKGWYYLGVHGYNRDFHTEFGNPKAFGEWGLWPNWVHIE